MDKEYNQNRTERERQIFHILIELMKTKNIDEITVSELICGTGISRSSFYRMFENVNDVVKNIEDDILETIRDICRYYVSKELDLNSSRIADGTLLTLFEFLHQIRSSYIALNSIHGDPHFRYKHEKLVKEFFGGRLAYHGISSEEPELFMTFLLAGHSSVIDYWLMSRPDITPERMVVLIQRLVYGMYKS